SGNMGQRTADGRLTFVPATGNLTANTFTSIIPTGAAPLVVASNTAVANLTSTNTLNTNVTDDVATATPVFPTFVNATSGYQNQRTASSRLSFVPSTGALTATSFVGTLNGNATSANTAINATNSTNSNITEDIVSPTVAYPVFVKASPGNQPLQVGPANLSYVPSTGVLTAKGFVGPLTGNVTGTATAALDAQRAVEISIANDVVSNTTMYPTFVSGITGTQLPFVSNTKLSFIPQTGELTATIFRGALSGNATSATNVTGVVAPLNGGTGVPNNNTLTLSGANIALTATGATNITLPTTGTLAITASPAFTGIPTAPTAAANTNTIQLATTEFVTAAGNLKANIASPALTGIPTAPTAAITTNNIQIATTAFVQAVVGMIKSPNTAPTSVVSVAANNELEVTYTVTGATTSGTVVASPNPALLTGLGIMSARVSATNVVTVRYRNFNAIGGAALSAGSLNLTVIQ
ncbi:hypothetical protein, partial [Daejeonella sp.]|uniref:hypothetical protein n=1 Tax=Daejeonella sp. TaxID=2805397 RepID=UPI0030C218B8